MIRVGGKGSRGSGIGYAKCDGYENLPIISRGKRPYCDLSPFVLGPIGKCQNLENFWQFQKVYKQVGKEVHLMDNEPTDAYYSWRGKGFALTHAVRRPNGRAIPEFCRKAWLYRVEKAHLSSSLHATCEEDKNICCNP
jgi:hypothetical protein